MLLTSLPEGIGYMVTLGASGGGGFFAIKWFAEFIGGRLNRREDRLDNQTRQTIADLRNEVNELRERCAVTERRLEECKDQHLLEKTERLKLQVILENKGIIDQKAQLIIAADKLADRERGA